MTAKAWRVSLRWPKDAPEHSVEVTVYAPSRRFARCNAAPHLRVKVRKITPDMADQPLGDFATVSVAPQD